MQFGGEFRDTLGYNNERAVHEYLVKTMKDRLEKYTTVFTEDQALLETELTDNQRNCVKLRLKEKEIVYFIMESSAYALILM